MSTPQTSLTHHAAPRLLLPELQALLLAHRAAFRQERVFRRAGLFLLGWLFAFGRKTLTQVLTALGWVHSDWTAWYRLLSRPPVGYERLTRLRSSDTLSHVPGDQP